MLCSTRLLGYHVTVPRKLRDTLPSNFSGVAVRRRPNPYVFVAELLRSTSITVERIDTKDHASPRQLIDQEKVRAARPYEESLSTIINFWEEINLDNDHSSNETSTYPRFQRNSINSALGDVRSDVNNNLCYLLEPSVLVLF